MPIRFDCSQCGQLMQTPDESAGKRARCPACQAVVDVPESSAAVVDSVTSAYRPPQDIDPGVVRETPTDSDIPGELKEALFGPPTEPRPYKITLDDLFQRTWGIFTNRLGICLLFALLLLGLNGTVSVLTFVINFSTQMAAAYLKMMWLMFVGQGISQILSIVFQSWLQAGAMLFMLNLARYGQASFNDTMRGYRYMWRMLLFQVLMIVLIYGIPSLLGVGGFVALGNQAEPIWIIAGFAPSVLIGLPLIVWFTMNWYLTIPYLVDRDLPLLQAMKESSRFMRGNRLIVFAGGAILGLASMLFLIITICIGFVFVIPLVMLFSAVVFLLATGQGMDPASTDQQPLQ
jgi:hypothetical protein